MPTVNAYDEFIEFIARGSAPADVAAFRPSEAARARAWELVEREKTGGLTPEESAELQYYLQLEHILRMAKARAKQVLRQNYKVASSGQDTESHA